MTLFQLSAKYTDHCFIRPYNYYTVSQLAALSTSQINGLLTLCHTILDLSNVAIERQLATAVLNQVNTYVTLARNCCENKNTSSYF